MVSTEASANPQEALELEQPLGSPQMEARGPDLCPCTTNWIWMPPGRGNWCCTPHPGIIQEAPSLTLTLFSGVPPPEGGMWASLALGPGACRILAL